MHKTMSICSHAFLVSHCSAAISTCMIGRASVFNKQPKAEIQVDQATTGKSQHTQMN